MAGLSVDSTLSKPPGKNPHNNNQRPKESKSKMPKIDYIPNGDANFLAWHDQFKTAAAAEIGQFPGIDSADC